MPRRISGALVLPLRGRVEATSGPSCPALVRLAPSTGFSCLQRCCCSRVLPRRAVVPTASSSARMLRGRGLLARAACLESLLASVPPQLPALLERGWGCSADLFFYRRHHCTWSWVNVLWNDPCIGLPIVRPKVLPFTRTGTRCTPESVYRSILGPLLPNLTSAPLIVSLPTLRRGLLTSLCPRGV